MGGETVSIPSVRKRVPMLLDERFVKRRNVMSFQDEGTGAAGYLINTMDRRDNVMASLIPHAGVEECHKVSAWCFVVTNDMSKYP